MYQEKINVILSECHSVLSLISEESTRCLIEKITTANKIFFVGVGRVMLSLQAIAKRWSHLGMRTHVVGEITEPALEKGDVLIVGSGSGETLFPKAIAQKAKTLGAYVIYIGANVESTIAGLADLIVRFHTNTKFNREDETKSKQIMTSLFEQSLLLYGDLVSMMIVEEKKIDIKGLWEYHANLE